jgi:hypothetical protein
MATFKTTLVDNTVVSVDLDNERFTTSFLCFTSEGAIEESNLSLLATLELIDFFEKIKSRLVLEKITLESERNGNGN